MRSKLKSRGQAEPASAWARVRWGKWRAEERERKPNLGERKRRRRRKKKKWCILEVNTLLVRLDYFTVFFSFSWIGFLI